MDAKEKYMQILDFSEICDAADVWEQDIPLQCAANSTWLWTHFSPYGHYFVAFKENGRLLLFEECPYRSTCTTSWKYIAQTAFLSYWVPIFHPTKPLISLTADDPTFIRSFESSPSCDLNWTLLVVNTRLTQGDQILEGCPRGIVEPEAKAIKLPVSAIVEEYYSKGILKDIEKATSTTIAVPDQDQWRLERSHMDGGQIGLGGHHIKRHKLKQYTDAAAIIWQTPMKESMSILRLPQSLAATKIDAIAAVSSHDKSRISVYLDKAQQEFYDLERPAKERFPMVIDRQADTLALTKSRLLEKQPKLIQEGKQQQSIRKDEQNDDDSSMIASSAGTLDTLKRAQTHRSRRSPWYQFLRDYDHPFLFSVSPRYHNALKSSLIWQSRFNATAKITQTSYSRAPLQDMESTTGPGRLVTVRRRKAAPLLVGGLENGTEILQSSAPHIQARTQRRQDRFHVFNDFSWGLLCGLLLGVFTSLIIKSIY